MTEPETVLPTYDDARKERRITLRITHQDLARLDAEARRGNTTIASVVRRLVREHLPAVATTNGHSGDGQ